MTSLRKLVKEFPERGRWDAYWADINEKDYPAATIAEALVLTILAYPDFVMGWAEHFHNLPRNSEAKLFQHQMVQELPPPDNAATAFGDPQDFAE